MESTLDAYVTAGCASWRALARDVSRITPTTAPRLWRMAHGVEPVTPAVHAALGEVSHGIVTRPRPRTDRDAVAYDQQSALVREMCRAALVIRAAIRAARAANAPEAVQDAWRAAQRHITTAIRVANGRRHEMRWVLLDLEMVDAVGAREAA